jgi:DNA-binding protein YbaB
MRMDDESPRGRGVGGRLGGPGLGTEEFQRLLDEARESLASMRRAARDAQPPPADATGEAAAPVEGSGEALDGLVRCTVAADGTVDELVLDPRLLRRPLAETADGVRAAINEAVADMRARRDPGVPDGVPDVDLEALGQRVSEIQTEGLRQMQRFSQTIHEVMARMRRP